MLDIPAGIPYLSGAYGIALHEKGQQVFAHIHNDWDLWFVVEGKATWELQNGRPITLEKNHFYLFPPYVCMSRKLPSTHLKLWFCHFDFHEIPVNVFTSFREDCLDRREKVRVPMVFSKREAPGVWRAYHDFLALTHDVPTGAQKTDEQGWLLKSARTRLPWSVSRALLLLVGELVYFAEQYKVRAPGNDEVSAESALVPHPHLPIFFRLFNKQPEHQWKTAELADILGLSVRQADRVFRSVTGQSLKQYVSSAQLRRAATLLTQNRQGSFLPLKTVSEMCGYASTQHFHRHFKKNMGLTPRAYRGRHS